jgi:hypothetical protein
MALVNEPPDDYFNPKTSPPNPLSLEGEGENYWKERLCLSLTLLMAK